MGVCLSCLRGRNKPAREPQSENEPLLDENNAAEYGSSESNDEQWLHRQQLLDTIVHKAQDFFIDVNALREVEHIDQISVGTTPLPAELATKLESVSLQIPLITKLTEEEHQMLEAELDSM